MTGWAITGVLASVAYLLRLAGVVVGRRIELGDVPAARLLRYLGPAVLGGLIAISTVGSAGTLVVDARLAGLLAGVVVVLLRAPILAVVFVAVGVTALVRLLGG